MSQTIDFPGKHEDEQFQISFRQHWMRMMIPMVRTALLSAGVVAVASITFAFAVPSSSGTGHIILLFFLTFFFGVQWEFLVRLYRYFLNIVIVTDRKIHHIKKTLLMVDQHESIDLWMLQEINKIRRGPFQNLLGFGTLRLEAQDTHISLHFVPHIDERYRQVMHLRERARSIQRPSMPPARQS